MRAKRKRTHIQGCRAIDYEILQALARNAHTNPANLFATDLDFDLSGMVDENTVATVADVERNTLVGLLARSSAVLVPNTDRLAWRESIND